MPQQRRKEPPALCYRIGGEEMCIQAKKTFTARCAARGLFKRSPGSAFLDKCTKPILRRSERHCEPNEVFNPDPKAKANPKSLSLTENIEESGKQLFAAYLDTMPLKWNVHFVLQAFMCDLYRTIGTNYAFVRDMGKEFMIDLERMANNLGVDCQTT